MEVLIVAYILFLEATTTTATITVPTTTTTTTTATLTTTGTPEASEGGKVRSYTITSQS